MKPNEGPLVRFELSPNCLGFSEKKDNCWNFTIISIDPCYSSCYNDYRAGYVQGKLQGENMLKASRNNSWDNAYLCEAEHTEASFPKQLPPCIEELEKAYKTLSINFEYLTNWLNFNRTRESHNILRLLHRMLGIYHGAINNNISSETDLECILQSKNIFLESGSLGYGDMPLSFEDIYFINAQLDLFDAISTSKEMLCELNKTDHCSAFLKRTRDDIYLAHNSWCGFLAQSHAITYVVRNNNNDKDERKNIDFVTQNAYCPGQFGSNMDFGFNGHGICFNETTHRYSKNKSKVDGIWLFWRAAAAEIFAQSIDDFYNHITIDNTGTYLNGYMLIDVNTKETALIEMSYKRFVLFRAKEDDKEYKVTEQRLGENKVLLSKDDYNPDLLCKEHIFGVNYPISYNVANDLLSRDNRPKRRIQLRERIGKVRGLRGAKKLITYVEKGEPLSIYGRWDLGYGNAGGYGKVIPDGAIDAKVFSANEVRDLLESLQFIPNEQSKKTSFWMLYGTAKMEGKPFIWSESKWKKYKKPTEKDFVPDVLKGKWNKTRLFID